jgi:hypothetical protein
MKPKFAFYEIVRILAQPSLIKEALVNKEGIIDGVSDPGEDNQRYYGVFINELGKGFGVPEDLLESTGRFATREDIISGSRGKGRRSARDC